MAKKLWGGRFTKKIDAEFERFSRSIHYDCALARIDVFHSIVHAYALGGGGILTKAETQKIIAALNELIGLIDSGKFVPDADSEDIHTDIHNKLEKKIGPLAAKVHTLRSRNDQIVFNEKFYCLDEAIGIKDLLNAVLKAIVELCAQYPDQPFIGYTHTQRAQVVLFSDYVMAYGRMFERDMDRLFRFYESVVPYIGAGALAGSSLDKKDYARAIDDFFSREARKKPKSVENALDNVSDRDFLIEFLGIMSIIQMHLSRFAEDMILYSTQEFNYVDLPEEFCTGSSLMPHKKNPDFLELVRGYTGRIYGNQFSLLTTMKGLPLSYNRDMQLDKEPLFSSVEVIKSELRMLARFIRGIRLKTPVIAAALKDETLYATELAEFLVKRGVPFQKAHETVGKLIRYMETNPTGTKMKISEMTDAMLKDFDPQLTQKDIRSVLNPQHAIHSKKSINRKKIKPHA